MLQCSIKKKKKEEEDKDEERKANLKGKWLRFLEIM